MRRHSHSRARCWIARFAAAAAGCIALLSSPAGFAQTAGPYAALEPLIGEWDVGAAGAAPTFVQGFSWGPKQSYVWVSVNLLEAGGEKHLHFEGLVLWNGASRKFDYLFVVEPGSLGQERGEIHVEADGLIVRDVALTAANGKTSRFRQTFRLLDAGRIETSLMRETDGGWAPTFPGSDRLTMVRREG